MVSVEEAVKCVKYIEKESKYLVYGFIRKYERELLAIHDENIFHSIPELIIITCLVF